MAKVIIITYNKSFDLKENSFIIGGLETYIQDIAHLVLSRQWEAEVILPAPVDFTTNCNGIAVRGIKLKIRNTKKVNQALYDYAIQLITSEKDRLIVATEQMAIKARHKQVIAIQHGIGFDMPLEFQSRKERMNHFISQMFKVLRCLAHIRKFNNYSNVVCVDFNYINWYRTLDSIRTDMNVWVVPNYSSDLIDRTDVAGKLGKRDCIKIIFARRFVEYRGCKIFIEVVKRLLDRFNNIQITFAGSGELQDEIESSFFNEPRVDITSFHPVESVKFHAKYDIAVVPTIFSEGTSLSLCEAMSAGCFPVVTYVGGLSNMILDGYNGLICNPDSDSFYEALVKALTMSRADFDQIVHNAHAIAEKSFGLERWQKQWINILGLHK